MIILKIFYWIALVIWGIALIKYKRVVKSWTWNFVWAEKYLGSWWTYFVLIFAWLFMIFIGFLYPFGWLELLFWNPDDIKMTQ